MVVQGTPVALCMRPTRSSLKAAPWWKLIEVPMSEIADEKNDFNLLLKTWYRIPESAMNDDNPGIEGYLGYGELWAYYYWGKHKFDIMFRNNLRFGDNRGAVQVDWAFPLTFIPFIKNDRISGYIQYFNGYGEGLLDYNASSNRISLGFMLTDWK